MRHDHLISARQLSRADVEVVLDRAAEFDAGERVDRTGDLPGLCFFDPSTRTKMSFDTAMKRPGGGPGAMGPVHSSPVRQGRAPA